MTRLYAIFNPLLATAAILVTLWVFTNRETSRASQRPETMNSLESPPPPAATQRTMATAEIPREAVQTLWENVIFSPTRQEGFTQTAPPVSVATESPSPTNLELMAVGIFGSRSAAVIIVNEPRQPTAPTRRRGAGGGGTRGTQRVYNIGESVGSTGYTVREIKMDEVILARGDEERVLRLAPSSDSSQRRREAAVAQERAVVAASQAESSQTARREARGGRGDRAAPPPPPPPPPVAFDANEMPADGEAQVRERPEEETDRDEQIRQAIERRRQIIEELRSRQSER